MTHTFRILLTLTLAATTGCGDTLTGPRQRASLSATSDPASITPIVCPQSSCGSLANQLEATATLTVSETAGVGGTIETLGLVLRRTSDNATIVNATPQINGRFNANGSTNVPVGVHWDRSQNTGAATLTVTVNARDDNQNVVTTTVTIPVAAFAGSTP